MGSLNELFFKSVQLNLGSLQRCLEAHTFGTVGKATALSTPTVGNVGYVSYAAAT